MKIILLGLLLAVTYAQKDCIDGGVAHKSGSSFQSSDGCNTCYCHDGLAACTLMACIPAGGMCHYNNQMYISGDSFASTDNCNTCVCQNGHVSCTEMFCIPSSPKPII